MLLSRFCQQTTFLKSESPTLKPEERGSTGDICSDTTSTKFSRKSVENKAKIVFPSIKFTKKTKMFFAVMESSEKPLPRTRIFSSVLYFYHFIFGTFLGKYESIRILPSAAEFQDHQLTNFLDCMAKKSPSLPCMQLVRIIADIF